MFTGNEILILITLAVTVMLAQDTSYRDSYHYAKVHYVYIHHNNNDGKFVFLISSSVVNVSLKLLISVCLFHGL